LIDCAFDIEGKGTLYILKEMSTQQILMMESWAARSPPFALFQPGKKGTWRHAFIRARTALNAFCQAPMYN